MIFLPTSRLYRPGGRMNKSLPLQPVYIWHGGRMSATTAYGLANSPIDGTLGSAVTLNWGPFGRAPRFDQTANSYIDVGSTGLLMQQPEQSFACWFKGENGSTGNRTLYGEALSGSVIYYHSFLGTGFVEFGISTAGTFKAATGATTVALGVWNFYAASLSQRDGMKVYLNGHQDGSHANTSVQGSAGNHSDIGAFFNAGARGNTFNGQLDMISLWTNRALYAEEVRAMYHSPMLILNRNMQRVPALMPGGGARSFAVTIG